jgi:hypothetical protein
MSTEDGVSNLNVENKYLKKNTLPIEPETLEHAIQIGFLAKNNKRSTERYEDRKLKQIEKKMREINNNLFFGTTFLNLLYAIDKEYGQDESKFLSIMNRFDALINLLRDNDPRMKSYLIKDKSIIKVDTVVIEIIASIPITPNGEIDKALFFKRLNKFSID